MLFADRDLQYLPGFYKLHQRINYFALAVQADRNAVECCGIVRMVRSQCGFPYVPTLLVKNHCIIISTLDLSTFGNIVE